MRVTCTNCGGAHTPWDCKRPAKKSTAARKDVRNDGGREDRLSRDLTSPIRQMPAGTQVLPVDTNSTVEESEVGSFPSHPYVSPTSAGTVGNEDRQPIQKRPRGRPKSITDMAAYKRAKQREYRAKWKGRE